MSSTLNKKPIPKATRFFAAKFSPGGLAPQLISTIAQRLAQRCPGEYKVGQLGSFPGPGGRSWGSIFLRDPFFFGSIFFKSRPLTQGSLTFFLLKF